jgi:hypothetical protein
MHASPWFGLSLILLAACGLSLVACLPAPDACSSHSGAAASLAAVEMGWSPMVLA